MHLISHAGNSSVLQTALFIGRPQYVHTFTYTRLPFVFSTDFLYWQIKCIKKTNLCERKFSCILARNSVSMSFSSATIKKNNSTRTQKCLHKPWRCKRERDSAAIILNLRTRCRWAVSFIPPPQREITAGTNLIRGWFGSYWFGRFEEHNILLPPAPF